MTHPSRDIRVSLFRDSQKQYIQMLWVDPRSRRPCKKSTRTTDPDEAEQIRQAHETALREGRARNPNWSAWQEFRRRYVEEFLQFQAVATADKMTGVLDALERTINPTRMSDVTSERIAYFATQMRLTRRLGDSTLKYYMIVIRSALRWAKSQGLKFELPQFELPRRAKRQSFMKGRPITEAEFRSMLALVPKHIPAEELEASGVTLWQWELECLWWSSLRLHEACKLSWDIHEPFAVDFTGKFPMFRIQCFTDKGRLTRLTPIAPEFCRMLETIPQEKRVGHVFSAIRRPGEGISKIITTLGRKADIKVHINSHGIVKYASAHDFRRAFGERWAMSVMPHVLQLMMRHESIDTTMRYYVGRNAQIAAEAIWSSIPGQT